MGTTWRALSRPNVMIMGQIAYLDAYGQERTEAEYRALYAAAGFTLTRVIPTRSRISLIEGTPV